MRLHLPDCRIRQAGKRHSLAEGPEIAVYMTMTFGEDLDSYELFSGASHLTAQFRLTPRQTLQTIINK